VAAHAPRATAAPPPTSADGSSLAIALRKYDEGRSAYHAGDYARALAAFQASLELRASPNTQLYIGRCLQRLGKLASAHAALVLAGKQAEDVIITQHDARYKATADAAASEAAALAPRVPHLEVILPPG